jgi:hypothetical protein
VQGCGDVRDCAVDAANREGISSQGRLSSRPGEPDAVKAARPVREGAVGKGPSGDTTCKETGRSTERNGTSLAAYFTAPYEACSSQSDGTDTTGVKSG